MLEARPCLRPKNLPPPHGPGAGKLRNNTIDIHLYGITSKNGSLGNQTARGTASSSIE